MAANPISEATQGHIPPKTTSHGSHVLAGFDLIYALLKPTIVAFFDPNGPIMEALGGVRFNRGAKNGEVWTPNHPQNGSSTQTGVGG